MRAARAHATPSSQHSDSGGKGLFLLIPDSSTLLCTMFLLHIPCFTDAIESPLR